MEKTNGFTGDTEVWLLTGEKKPFKDIVDSGEQSHVVYAFDPVIGKYIDTKAIYPKVVIQSNKIARITLSNGLTFSCTPEQKIMTKDCLYTSAKNLIPNTELKSMFGRGKIFVVEMEIVTLDEYVDIYAMESNVYNNYVISTGCIVHD